jgi:hypothetical protein
MTTNHRTSPAFSAWIINLFLGVPLLALLVPAAASAGAMLEVSCVNSRAIYGVEARHFQSSPCFLSADGGDPAPGWEIFTGWSHTSPTLLDLILERDASGEVVRSHYKYAGGEFELFFNMFNILTGDSLFGTLVMPILSMDVFSDERGGPSQGVEFYATLGTGRLDAAIADVLRIGRSVRGGRLSDPFLSRIFDEPTTYTDDFREASEGAPTLLVEVPEPPLWMLGVLGVSVLRSRLRRLTKSAPVRVAK